MGQTLTHGVYLPDEGERNCYSGLAANWQILDSSVGTIAAHTAALAGKAPLVHTHVKADITDFPAYGTTAGTICEGNDSRLSDARTPVAHTHTKSDVTDLFNSANTWGGSNTYASNVNLYNSDNTQDTPTLYLRNSKAIISSSGNTAGYQGIYFNDGNNSTLAFIRGAVQSNGCVANLKTFTKDSNNNTVESGFQIGSFTDGSKWLAPSENGTISLGGINYKWKTLNGINPGALSFPGTGGFTDIKGDITNLSGGDNTFTAPYDGWVCIKSTNATVIHIINTPWAVSQSATQSNAGTLCCLCPVMSGQSFKVIVNATSLEYAYIHPCKGNV